MPTRRFEISWLLRKPQNLAAKRGQIVQAGIIWGQKRRPLYGVEGWPRNRGFLCTILRTLQSGPRSVSAIWRVVASQGWSLRGVPLYYSPIPIPSLYVVILNLQKISFTCIHSIIVCVLHHVTPYIATVYIYSLWCVHMMWTHLMWCDVIKGEEITIPTTKILHVRVQSIHTWMKALKCKTLGACMAWQVMVSWQIADHDSEVHIAISDT